MKERRVSSVRFLTAVVLKVSTTARVSFVKKPNENTLEIICVESGQAVQEHQEKKLLAEVQQLTHQVRLLIHKVEEQEKEIAHLQHEHRTFVKLVKHDISEIARLLDNKKDKMFGRNT